MVHTLPDYTSKYKNNTVSGIADNAELAARLGSIVTFSRTGNVIALDDFEGATLFWDTTGAGVGAFAGIVADWGKSGSQSCKLTAGAGAGGLAGIYKYFGVATAGKLALEISFTVDDDTDHFSLNFIHHDGTNRYAAYIEYDHANNRFEIDDDGVVRNILPGSDLLAGGTNSFHTWKLFIDTSTRSYDKMIVDNIQTDLSAYTIPTILDPLRSSIYVYMRHYSTDVAAKTIWIDNFILTQNEL